VADFNTRNPHDLAAPFRDAPPSSPVFPFFQELHGVFFMIAPKGLKYIIPLYPTKIKDFSAPIGIQVHGHVIPGIRDGLSGKGRIGRCFDNDARFPASQGTIRPYFMAPCGNLVSRADRSPEKLQLFGAAPKAPSSREQENPAFSARVSDNPLHVPLLDRNLPLPERLRHGFLGKGKFGECGGRDFEGGIHPQAPTKPARQLRPIDI
jgi:hypothetical protein